MSLGVFVVVGAVAVFASGVCVVIVIPVLVMLSYLPYHVMCFCFQCS